ncbi:hypothetical protein CYMTET_23479 [Cymbomonas tetramitiformis]|uniref:Transposase n=1 Tax=Cymbomonas tetramitiformis TaxID=36881 RepID=A0AAE0L181_9CHLO|nr:hypothetical protein CYMTET_23479 [Cymbomonas tetramitiformis]
MVTTRQRMVCISAASFANTACAGSAGDNVAGTSGTAQNALARVQQAFAKARISKPKGRPMLDKNKLSRTLTHYYKHHPIAKRRRGQKHKTVTQKQAIIDHYCNLGKPGFLKTVKDICKKFNCNRKYPRRVTEQWRQRKGDLSRKRSVQMKTVLTERTCRALMKLQRANRRKTDWELKKLMAEGGFIISRRSISAHLRKEKVTRFKLKYKPLLTRKHMQDRLAQAKRLLHDTFENRIDVDEKYFEIESSAAVEKRRHDDALEYTAFQSRKFIPKVMFLTAVAKPNIEHGFDGKVGIWRITEKKTAQRKSRNYERNEEYDVDVTLTGERFSKLMKEVCATAKKKMPWLEKRVVQIDGAGPHQGVFKEVVEEGKRLGAVVERQAAQMPDGNRNDLVVYPALQRQADKLCEGERKHIDTVVKAVYHAWDNMRPETLHMACEIQRVVYASIIEHNGGNRFKVPHIGLRVEVQPYIYELNEYFDTRQEIEREEEEEDVDDSTDDDAPGQVRRVNQAELVATSWQAKEQGRKRHNDESVEEADEQFMVPTNLPRRGAPRARAIRK